MLTRGRSGAFATCAAACRDHWNGQEQEQGETSSARLRAVAQKRVPHSVGSPALSGLVSVCQAGR